MQETCLFCRIVRGDLNADVVAEGDGWLAFRDVNPQAPTHVLLIPREHVTSLADAQPEHADLLGRMQLAAAEIARDEGLEGWRLVVNVGPEGGQSVFHLHLHLLGGRRMTWPPG